MTPAVRILEAEHIAHEVLTYQLQGTRVPDSELGAAAATALAIAPERVFKTLVAELNSGALVVAIVPVLEKLNMKQLARAAKAKSASMADVGQVERVTGYLKGGISPLGQKKQLPTFLASEGVDLQNIYVSGGQRGLELGLKPADLIRLTNAVVCELTG